MIENTVASDPRHEPGHRSTTRSPRADLLPIDDGDVEEVAEYLHRQMTTRVSARQWAEAMRAPWQRDPPNHGFLLRQAGKVVGAHLALYSVRSTARGHVDVCNLAAWCVDPDQRFNSTRLLRALLAQPGFEFVDLSPSGNVIALNERLGFRHVDTTTYIIPTIAPPYLPRADITSHPGTIRAALTELDLRIYLDHERSPAVKHLLVAAGSRTCHVMYRRDRRRNLPVFASVLHLSEPATFRSLLPSVKQHLALRGVAALLCESRHLGSRPAGSFLLAKARPKMFRGNTLTTADIDDLYSELTEVAW